MYIPSHPLSRTCGRCTPCLVPPPGVWPAVCHMSLTLPVWLARRGSMLPIVEIKQARHKIKWLILSLFQMVWVLLLVWGISLLFLSVSWWSSIVLVVRQLQLMPTTKVKVCMTVITQLLNSHRKQSLANNPNAKSTTPSFTYMVREQLYSRQLR